MVSQQHELPRFFRLPHMSPVHIVTITDAKATWFLARLRHRPQLIGGRNLRLCSAFPLTLSETVNESVQALTNVDASLHPS
jgi:hypothetical protein